MPQKNLGDSDSEVFDSFEMVKEDFFHSRRAEVIPQHKLNIGGSGLKEEPVGLTMHGMTQGMRVRNINVMDSNMNNIGG